MKNIRTILLLSLLIVFLMGLCSVGVSASPAVPSISAGSAVVLDADTGVYYYEKGADTRRAQASMTKLMTAYMIFEAIDAGKLDFDTVITIGPQGQKVAYTGGYSNVPLNRGEQYTVDTMLKLILLPSACGACASMAECISGTESAFVAEMNATAAEMGLNAHFTNTYGAGVGMPNHYITARSQAILAMTFMTKYPDILKYTSLNSVYFKGNTYYNTNHFLNTDYYAGVNGMKTGTNGEAGGCITVSAERNGRRIVVVVMKSGVRYSDARKLLDYGFARVAEADNAAKNASFTLSGTTREEIRVGTDFVVAAKASSVTAPFCATGYWTVNGEKVAEFCNVKVSNGSSIVGKLNLDAYAEEDVTIGFVMTLPDGTQKSSE
ncbi:MAG: D-alanyl-D-alanine carboxypeptidase, partial [Firmicutes bacterium]|nr:D-alanyl-D-alanine carboxypeptidase [Bacillota bacterium]